MKLYRIPEAADQLAIGRSRLYEMMAAGEILTVKIGSRGVRISDAEIDRFINDRLAIHIPADGPRRP